MRFHGKGNAGGVAADGLCYKMQEHTRFSVAKEQIMGRNGLNLFANSLA